MTVPQYFRLIGRETRGAGGRLAYFTFCLAIGVAAVVSVASLGSSLGKGFRDGAREMLAADITAETFQPPPPELDTAIAALSKQFDGRVEVTQTREQPTLVSRVDDDGSVLSEIKVIDGTYPFYGSLDLQPPGDFNEFLTLDSAIVEPKVLDTLRLSVGDVLRVGGQDFTIRAVANAEPDRIAGFMYIGPRVFLSKAGFDRTPLGELGVRVRRKTLLKLPDAPAETVIVAAQLFKDALGEDSPLRVENYVEGRRSIQRGLGRLENFLGLIALLSLLLGGVGVAQAVRAWISGRLDSIAVLKCVGVRPREVLALYFGQSAMLGFVGSGAGVLLAILMLIVIPPFLKEYMPADLVDPIQPAAILRGLLLGASVSVVFSLPPLISILRVPPSRVFRRDAEPLAEARWVPWATAVAIVIGVAAMAALQANSLTIGMQFACAVLGAASALAAAAWGLTRLVSRLPRDGGAVAVRHGLASLSRPGSSTIASIMALGLGVLVLFTTVVLQTHLNRQLESDLPKDAPSMFMVDARPDQTEGLATLLKDHGATNVTFAPLVMARATALKGVSVETLLESSEHMWRRRQLMGEQFLTYLPELSPDNEIVRGELWPDPARPEVSLEEDYARDFHLDIGDTITFDFGGKETELLVSSIRTVKWEGLGINFQLVVEPGVIEGVPQRRVATARLPKGEELGAQDAIAAAFPNVTLLRVGDALDRIAAQLKRIGWGVRFLGLFIVGAGIAVLTGTIGIESQRRGREVALLKTLGMTRRGVSTLFATEYALIGLVAGVIGVTAGSILGYLAITRAMEIEWYLNPALPLGALAATIILATTAGIAASAPALGRPPIDTLRQE